MRDSLNIYILYIKWGGVSISMDGLSTIFFFVDFLGRRKKKSYGKDDKPKKLNHVSFHYLQIIYIIVLSCVFFWEGWKSFFQARKKSVERNSKKR